MKLFFLGAFFLAAAGVLVGEWLDISALYQVSKPLIMIGLAGYYVASLTAGDRSPILLFALFFSWLGDVALMFPGDIFFISGLCAFLISLLFYIVTFRQHRHPDGTGFSGIQSVRYAFPVILAGTGLMTILYPSLDGLEVPVSIYAVVLTVMVLQALFRFGYTGIDSFWRVLSGAILFMLSDSMLSIDKFLSPFPASGLLVMFTYMSAQFLIVKGLLRHGN